MRYGKKASLLGWAAGLVMIVAGGPAGLAQDTQSGNLKDAGEHFVRACSVCHGPDGKGGGPIAAQLKTPPPDLTGISKRSGGEFPRQQIYEQIEGLAMPSAHGTREMPVWGAVILFEELGSSVAKADAKKAETETRRRLELLVDYLQSIQE